jgi:poly(3-hydroxyalkanoate) synthetase
MQQYPPEQAETEFSQWTFGKKNQRESWWLLRGLLMLK